MTDIELAFIVLVLAAFALFMGTLGYVSWWSELQSAKDPKAAQARETPPEVIVARQRETRKKELVH